MLGALGRVGRGFGSARRAALGWAWGLALVGVLGWVGRGVWLWWVCWAGLGVGFGSGGCAGLGWAWGLALVGVLGWVGGGFGFLCMVYNVHAFFMSS